MNPDNGDFVFLGLLHGTDHHLMRDGFGKQDHQIRGTDLFFHGTVFLGKDLGIVAVALTDLLIAADHTFVSADDDNAHGFTFLSYVVSYY